MRSPLLAAALVALSAGAASASPLTLEYSIIVAEPGVLRYIFTLRLDNHDHSWIPGQSFNWITFGDVLGPGTSNLPDFIGDPPAPGPFADEGYSYSAGGHNGPTLLDFGTNFDFRGWVPEELGDSLTWSGTSTFDIPGGQLKWSNLIGTGVPADFETAIILDGYCPADFDESGGVDGQDVEAFFRAWEDGLNEADVNRDGSVEGSDVETFFRAWENGGC